MLQSTIITFVATSDDMILKIESTKQKDKPIRNHEIDLI
jgi:hypothetical protein